MVCSHGFENRVNCVECQKIKQENEELAVTAWREEVLKLLRQSVDLQSEVLEVIKGIRHRMHLESLR